MVFLPLGVFGMERRCRMKRYGLITVLTVYVLLGLAACDESVKPPPTQIIDAPLLSSALKWVGGCGVLCSFLGATALIVASRRTFKDK